MKLSRRSIAVALALAAGAAGTGCGELPNPTLVRDLRVLAVKADPPGFLIDLAQPGAVTPEQLTATVTALVVDPEGNGAEVTYFAQGCPDYLDTITAATGQRSKICPPASATVGLPEALQTVEIIPPGAPGVALPDADTGIEYAPDLDFGFTPSQVEDFFSLTGIPAIDEIVALNRDFGLAAIVDMTFSIGGQTAEALKRVIYWPLLAVDQQANRNPELGAVQLFKRRNPTTGVPEDPWLEVEPTLSIAAGDKLFVLPVDGPGAREPYLLRVKNTATLEVETRLVEREFLEYSFFATDGAFSPGERESELSPLLTSPDGRVPLDSEWILPAPTKVIRYGKVFIWVVVRDERGGTAWLRRTINLAE